MVLCEPSWSNIRCIKAVLRGFELISGLNINLSKSCIMSVNVEENFLTEVASYLCCETGSIPFVFLGIPIGLNQRQQDVWLPIVRKMKRRLSTWKRRFLSKGGRITLINSVLNYIPIYYLSFFKIQKLVLKTLIKIQREFLWGGRLDRKGIAWVKWKRVCDRKENKGLGLICMEAFNQSLLCKWKWRFLVERNVVWRQLLQYRYGSLEDAVLDGVSKASVKNVSLWWRDVVNYNVNGDLSDWFLSGLCCRLGSGKVIKFWHNNWLEGTPLKEQYPTAFRRAADNLVSVAGLEGGFANAK